MKIKADFFDIFEQAYTPKEEQDIEERIFGDDHRSDWWV